MKTRAHLRGSELIEERARLVGEFVATAGRPVHRADLAALLGLASPADRGVHRAAARAKALGLITSRPGNGGGYYPAD